MWPWQQPLTGGPDAQRYIYAACGAPVPRPFNLRWFLPASLGTSPRAWWFTWLAAWPIMSIAMFAWVAADHGWQIGLAATLLLAGLPGILGPKVVIPIGVDLPATAIGLIAAALLTIDSPYAVMGAILAATLAGTIKESTPVWVALWCWSPWPLIGLIAPALAALITRPGPDPLGPQFQHIADHPVRTAIAAHTDRWRDAWLMLAPWGVCLAALHSPDWRLFVVLAVAYLQLLVATDTVRLVHHAAGPAMAVAAATTIPTAWLPLAVAAHLFWWRTPERL